MSSYIVGRSETADIIISDNGSVSNQHLELSLHNGRWLVVDLNSTNGTYLDRAVGKTKVSREYVDVSDYLYLGNCKVQVADLVAHTQHAQSKVSSSHKPSTTSEEKATYSRYLKAEDGRFVRKNK